MYLKENWSRRAAETEIFDLYAETNFKKRNSQASQHQQADSSRVSTSTQDVAPAAAIPPTFSNRTSIFIGAKQKDPVAPKSKFETQEEALSKTLNYANSDLTAVC